MHEWTPYLGLFGAGLLAGIINVLAGGGSFLTLPVLIFLGLPPSMANGTNRVGILVQNVGAVWGFRRRGLLDGRSALLTVPPAVAGSILGVTLAVLVSDDAFRRILALLMVAISLWTILAPARGGFHTSLRTDRNGSMVVCFLLVGIYGGFVQAGVGFLILAATTFGGLDLVRGNALKVLVILVFTAVALTVFAFSGLVHWGLGLILALGTVLGGQIGVHLTVLKGHRWIRRVVTATIVVFAVKLWFWS